MAFTHLKKFILRKPSMFFCSVRLTSMCSQNCLQCSIPAQSDGSYLKTEDFAVIAGKLKSYGSRVLTFTGGEPALHPQLEQIFNIAQKQEFRALNLLTNLYYSEEHQDKVIDLAIKYKVGIHTSYDGIGSVADRLRGAKDVQNTVERGMLKINELRNRGLYPKKPTATVVVSALNIDQLPEIIARVESMNWNLNIDLYRWSSANHREEDALKIRDKTKILDAISTIRKARSLKTPLWYYDGLQNQHTGKQRKQCPYLISPTFGSKFFVHENGDIYTCLNKVLGNLLQDDIVDLFDSPTWKSFNEDFQRCTGCWNNCFTVSSRALSYFHAGTIKQYLRS